MKVTAAVLVALAAACSAAPAPYPSHLVPAPQFDSAVIKSDRLGGNFAYSTLEARAYAAVSPVVQNVVAPVGVSYHATPVQAVYPAYQPAYVAAPFYTSPPATYPVPIAPFAPVGAPFAPATAPFAPVATPVADAIPFAPEAAPVAPAAPLADSVEVSASSDDSVTIEAA